MKKSLFLTAMGIVVIVISCSKSNDGGTTPPAVDCSTIPAKFAADIQPIISGNCASAGCHGDGSTNGPGELTTYTKIKNAAGSIKSAVVAKRMPKGGSLTEAQIQKISCWVDGGAQNN
jgi:hypothetical protein